MDLLCIIILNFGGFFGEEDGNSAEANLSAIGGGVRAGYQWIFGSGFTLDINLRASYKTFTYKYDNAADEEFYGNDLKASGVLLTRSFGLGYAF
ncbi:DUF3575 domain-containing protein [Frigoriflavimonas asaccharolytica]|uniref:Uncharacterized protein n=1 Tax=Frigoriflavimonas asaccharolytica TaxID=2735899 RepID=A0A8J8G9W8_9FLAO|nr:hypothetical protein [Frigoriflavimonas asaccharolytica]NRS91990.1 hypothetical protein [Frigoriflavimonas asaccharolytica]